MSKLSLAEIENLFNWLARHKTGLDLIILKVVDDLLDLHTITFNHGLEVLLLASDARACVLTYFK